MRLEGDFTEPTYEYLELLKGERAEEGKGDKAEDSDRDYDEKEFKILNTFSIFI